MESEGILVVRGRVEIDMRQPFRSVKEAISLFGEKVLAGEIYTTNKLKETQWKVDKEEKELIKSHQSVTKERLIMKKANGDEEGNNLMSFYLNSLKQELEETKKELQFLKTTTKEKHDEDEEEEELKFVENGTTKFVEATTTKTEEEEDEKEEEGFVELEKKRSVKFARSPLLTRMLVTKDIAVAAADEKEDMENGDLFGKKKRRKPLFPLFGRLFSKEKGAQKTKNKSFKE